MILIPNYVQHVKLVIYFDWIELELFQMSSYNKKKIYLHVYFTRFLGINKN